MTRAVALAAICALAGCPSFHPAALPGAPADATFADVDGVHVHYRAVGQGLLLWGADDQVTPLSFGQRLVNELADARLAVYPKCGHIPMVEARAVSTRDLADFLAKDEGHDDKDPGSGGGGGSGSSGRGSDGGGGGIDPGGGGAGGGGSGGGAVTIEPDRRSAAPALTPELVLPLGADLECFGEVARAESKQDEANADFTTAAYLRRFALGR